MIEITVTTGQTAQFSDITSAVQRAGKVWVTIAGALSA